MNNITLLLIILIVLYMGILWLYYQHIIYPYQKPIKKTLKWSNIVSGCYYINLDRSKDRRKYIEELMKNYGISCERFCAIDGKDIYMPNYSRITSGALGCKLSHLELLKKVKKDGWTIIFEDDIAFDINNLVTNSVKNDILYYLTSVPKNTELVLLGVGFFNLLRKFLTFECDGYSRYIWKTKGNINCMHAYAITYTGAQKFIQKINENLYKVPIDMHDKGIDDIYFCSKLNGLSGFFRLLCLIDSSFVIQDKSKFGWFQSTIAEYPFLNKR